MNEFKSTDQKAIYFRDRIDSAAFASLFVIFSFVLVLPILYGIGKPYYRAIQMELPVVTSLFMKVPPTVMILVGFSIVALVWAIRITTTHSVSRRVNWTVFIVTAIVTLLAVFAFASPMLSLLSGLGEL